MAILLVISTWWCLLTVVVLQPFPDWEMQEIGNPSALQYVQSMEIDLSGKMWIVDVGRLNILEADPSKVVNGCSCSESTATLLTKCRTGKTCDI